MLFLLVRRVSGSACLTWIDLLERHDQAEVRDLLTGTLRVAVLDLLSDYVHPGQGWGRRSSRRIISHFGNVDAVLVIIAN